MSVPYDFPVCLFLYLPDTGSCLHLYLDDNVLFRDEWRVKVNPFGSMQFPEIP